MGQTTRSLSLEVKPDSRDVLAARIDSLREASPVALGGQQVDYAKLLAQMPSLHFLSVSLLDDDDYDPLFVLEVNFDGAPGPFWAQLQGALGEQLRGMLQCCKRPRDGWGELHDAVTASGSIRDVAPYLERRAASPNVCFHGNRGLTRERIVAEQDLFEQIQHRLGGGGGPIRAMTPDAIHLELREAMLEQFPWVAKPAPRRIPLTERIRDWAQLVLLVLVLLMALSSVGIAVAVTVPDLRLAILTVVLVPVVWIALHRIAPPTHGAATKGGASLGGVVLRNALVILLVLGVFTAFALPIVAATGSLLTGESFRSALAPAGRLIAWGLLWMGAIVLPGLLLWQRWLERRDSSLDAPTIDQHEMVEMARLEDWLPQNHMAAISPLRPQILRRVIVFVGERLLRAALPALVLDGYVGNMRTIHFAHWAVVNNGSRLLFVSNFDLSWESYFDDFIEKAHEGLTLIWGSCVGFPPVTMLIKDGAAHGRQFKRWARHSMAVSRFWFSAYPDLTVDQIERNNRVASGIRRASLTPKEAETWLQDL